MPVAVTQQDATLTQQDATLRHVCRYLSKAAMSMV